MITDTDRYVIRCNSFLLASVYAAEHNWSLREWSWMPAYTVSHNIQVFERIEG